MRQSDHALSPQGVAIFHAHGVELHGKRLTASQVSVFRLDGRDRLLTRIEAGQATLGAGAWQLQDARTIRPEQMPEPPATISLPTDLTVARVQESFASPDTLSFWALPDFIALLDRSGFSSIRHRLHFQALLAQPLLCATMGLVAAGFSMRPARRGGVAKMITSGVATGFALFLISKIAEEFGQYRRPAGGARRMGARSIGHDAGNRAAVAHGRRLRMARAFVCPALTRPTGAAGNAIGSRLAAHHAGAIECARQVPVHNRNPHVISRSPSPPDSVDVRPR